MLPWKPINKQQRALFGSIRGENYDFRCGDAKKWVYICRLRSFLQKRHEAHLFSRNVFFWFVSIPLTSLRKLYCTWFITRCIPNSKKLFFRNVPCAKVMLLHVSVKVSTYSEMWVNSVILSWTLQGTGNWESISTFWFHSLLPLLRRLPSSLDQKCFMIGFRSSAFLLSVGWAPLESSGVAIICTTREHFWSSDWAFACSWKFLYELEREKVPLELKFQGSGSIWSQHCHLKFSFLPNILQHWGSDASVIMR